MKPNTLSLTLVSLLTGFALLQPAQAVVPPPDGGYPGFNTAEGTDALFSNTTGARNTGLGFQALYSNSTSSYNTAEGFRALFSNTSGTQNTASGAEALLMNTSGVDNTAVGWRALRNNVTGSENTATGANALQSNTSGIQNSAFGKRALFFNNDGNCNTAVGFKALDRNTGGDYNTAVGCEALQNNSGVDNTAVGFQALQSHTTGAGSVAIGFQALASNTTGGGNTAIGRDALRFNTGNRNTAIGDGALYDNTTGVSNIALGSLAGLGITSGNENIHIGEFGAGNESNTIRIGSKVIQTRAFIAGIRGVTTGSADAIPVLIDSAGQLGTASSSRRFKKEIKPMDRTSESILALKPATFQYKNDNTSTPQFGLIAEEVAAVNPNLVVHDDKGEIYTVRYDAVNAMLLNEFLKEHRKNEEQQTKIEQQDGEIALQQKQIESLTAGLRKVSAQLELSKSTPQTVLNNQ
jgi:Chaperone of endosialidase